MDIPLPRTTHATTVSILLSHDENPDAWRGMKMTRWRWYGGPSCHFRGLPITTSPPSTSVARIREETQRTQSPPLRYEVCCSFNRNCDCAIRRRYWSECGPVGTIARSFDEWFATSAIGCATFIIARLCIAKSIKPVRRSSFFSTQLHRRRGSIQGSSLGRWYIVNSSHTTVKETKSAGKYGRQVGSPLARCETIGPGTWTVHRTGDHHCWNLRKEEKLNAQQEVTKRCLNWNKLSLTEHAAFLWIHRGICYLSLPAALMNYWYAAKDLPQTWIRK